jgi:DNA repair protein RecO (recombination protein O)
MRVALQRSCVLHTRPYRDSSMLLELFSRDCGRVSLVAKGARGARRRGGTNPSLLQPFQPLLCSWSGRSELKTLTACEADGSALTLPGQRLYSGLYVNELVVRLLHHEDPHPQLFDHYYTTLAELGAVEDVEPTLRRFELDLLRELGYGFDLAYDGSSGEPLGEDEWYRFDSEQGLVATGEQGGRHQYYLGAELLRLGSGEFDRASRRCAKRLLREALAVYLGARPLHSRALFVKH